MIITLNNANFSAANIGVTNAWNVLTTLGYGAIYSGPSRVIKGAALSASITIEDGFDIGSSGVAVSMGGNPLVNEVEIVENTVNLAIETVTADVDIQVPTATNLLPIASYITSSYLNNGAIAQGSKDYRTGKFHLPYAGNVRIATNYAIVRTDLPFTFLVKYTDSSYSTVDKIILKTPSGKVVDTVFALDSGYYAVCWNFNSSQTDPSTVECIVNYDGAIVKIPEPTVTVEGRKYIRDGAITTGDTTYRLAKFTLSDAAAVHISTKFANTRTDVPFCFLVKYTDSTYSIADKIIIKAPLTPVIDQSFELDAGYYAVAWVNGKYYGSDTPNAIDDDECIISRITLR